MVMLKSWFSGMSAISLAYSSVSLFWVCFCFSSWLKVSFIVILTVFGLFCVVKVA